MPPRQRKIVGAVVIVAVVVIYPFFAMALADSRPMAEAPEAIRALGYMILGLAWTLPLFPLIKWMEGGARPAPRAQ
jgi:hypothetical protein